MGKHIYFNYNQLRVYFILKSVKISLHHLKQVLDFIACFFIDQVLEDDGGLWSCLVNSACLALIDSGISMRCLFAAVNVAVTNDGEVIVDPGKGFFFGLGLTRFT